MNTITPQTTISDITFDLLPNNKNLIKISFENKTVIIPPHELKRILNDYIDTIKVGAISAST